jgi:WD40 repeat protein
VNFSSTQTAGSVYVAQTGGNPNPDNNVATDDSDQRVQLQKFQTDTTNLAAPPQATGQANFTPGRVLSENVDPNISSVQAEQVGPDGSVYMLANVTGSVEGQAIDGTQDVALLKYDSAGHLLYTRTLGASSTATGLGLAVSSTGQVAVTGSVTGALSGATNGALNSSTGSGDSDSFVTLYDSSGNELWTERRGSSGNDQANQVSFSADGSTVYVAGNATGTMPGGTPIGGQDGYIEAFQTTAAGNPKVMFTQSFGTTGQDSTKGMVVDGNSLITASVENGDAVLRNFDISSGTPVLTNTRDLGSLQGGTIAGLGLNGNQVVIAGTTANGALSVGNVTSAAAGGTNAFAAQVDASLTPDAATDAIAYYGPAGTQATTMAVSNGQVWIGGTATAALPGQTFVGTKDGFIAQLNISTGQVVSSNEFTGKDGMASPTAIAVNTTGASALDRLGLPSGTLGGDTSQQLTAQSSLRAGEQFTVSAGSGPPTTITIKASDTLATLATEIQRASGSEATATIVNLGSSSKLTITPAYASALVTLGAGPAGNNALATLGLPEGVLNQTVTANDVTTPADGGSDIYGLGLSSTLDLTSKSQISLAKASIGAAMGEVRQAYQQLVTDETPTNPAQKAAAAAANGSSGGTVPAYLTNEIANLNAGLARLTAGQNTSTTSTLI